MKLKYYLRGLGIGIIITTLILMVTLSGGKEKLSDDEIIQRAEALGMVMADTEETKNSDQNTEEVKTQPETESETDSATEVQPETESESETAADAQPDTETNAGTEVTGEVSQEPVPAPDADTSSEVSFTVKSGESSDTVAFNLYKAGLVDDATAFNRYMVSKGFDSRLRTGNFEIKTGASYDDILKILAP